jgi:pyridoxal biosynthesis lyase PdxS
MATNTHDQLEEKMDKALAIKKDGEPGKGADISEAVGVLKEIVDEIVTDTSKFDGDKMNKTAGTRVRKYLMLVKKSTTNLRKAVKL